MSAAVIGKEWQQSERMKLRNQNNAGAAALLAMVASCTANADYLTEIELAAQTVEPAARQLPQEPGSSRMLSRLRK